jgi:ubiquinone/menaquinone biosynthesis C-methylase UbiE
MKLHGIITRKLFNQIHIDQIKDKKGVDKIKQSLNEKILGLEKGYFNDKICSDLGCGSTGSGGLNLLNLGAKYCHLMDLEKHIAKPIKKNLSKFKNKFEVNVGSLEKLPYEKNFFDFILCQGVIHHMDNDKKGFKEIYRTLKKGGKSFILIHGEGGIINDFTMKIIRPKYKSDPKFKLFIDHILEGNHGKYLGFLKKNYDKDTKKLIKNLDFLFDKDLLLSLKDRILAPKYKTYQEKDLRKRLKSIGFKNIYRIKKDVKFTNIRRLVAPLYHHYDNEISRMLYGDGIIQLVVQK